MCDVRVRFTLATLLISVAYVAAAARLCAAVPAYGTVKMPFVVTNVARPYPVAWELLVARKPTLGEFAWRMAWASPLAVGAALAPIWIVRRAVRNEARGEVGVCKFSQREKKAAGHGPAAEFTNTSDTRKSDWKPLVLYMS